MNIMSNRKILLLLISVLLLCTYILVRSNLKIDSRDKEMDQGSQLYLRKLRKDLSDLGNISFIKEIFTDIENTKNDINYIYIYYDGSCSGCVLLGKKLINTVNPGPFYTLYLSNTGSKENYGETKYRVTKESTDYYLDKINYIHTPVIIKFDSSYNVIDGFFPAVHKDSEFNEFVE